MFTEEWNDIFDVTEVFGDESEYVIETKKDVDEALVTCMNTYGKVDMHYIQDVTGYTLFTIVQQLQGSIFQDPERYDSNQDEYEDWLLRDQYLSGNIRNKYDIAKKLNTKYAGRFNTNIQELKKRIPDKIPFEQIGISIGSPWIPASVYKEFAHETLRLFKKPTIEFSKSLHQWKVTLSGKYCSTVANTSVFGTHHMDALHILEHSLNGSTVKIYDTEMRNNKEVRVLNKEATQVAQEKQISLQNKFLEWIRQNKNQMELLTRIYNKTYCSNVASRYDGNFLRLEDLNPDIHLYPHQKNAVARIVLDDDILLNHEVGSGKTYEIIVGIHERKRMGLSEKNLVVVPNNVLEAFERAHHTLYPNDSIYVIHPEDFGPASREEVLSNMKFQNYDAMYMAFSSFDRIGLSREYQLQKKAEDIQKVKNQIMSSNSSWEKKRLEKKASKLSEELVEMEMELPLDTYTCFDQLGITTLAVDEAHNYKNISIHSHADVVGMHAKGSKKCDNFYDKVQYIRTHKGAVIFSTGTPLTNSITDLYVLQKYLQPEQLELLNISEFDEWAGNFCERRSGFEIDVDSQNYRIMTRFSNFHNLPELTNLFANVCDFYSGQNSKMGLPKCEGYIDTVIPKSKEQKDYIEELVIRTEIVRAKLVSKEEDNLLKITHDGRSVALDPRLLGIEISDSQQTKAYACAKNVYEMYKKYPDTSQLVFCDLGTPKSGFNLYDELKQFLMQFGISKKEIAYIHTAKTDAQKRKLFEKVNNASVRVLIGSSSKLGQGVNVQAKLIAIHHLDLVWRPAENVQREGRLIRQGNTNDEVFRFRYITSGTFDSYSYQILENKQRFISRFMNNELLGRETRDIDDFVLSYAEIKALSVGDPLIKTRIETSNALEKTKMFQRGRNRELNQMETIVNTTPSKLKECKKRIKAYQQDMQTFQTHREKLSQEERLAFGEDLLLALQENNSLEERFFFGLHGFEILLPAQMAEDKPYVMIQSKGNENRYEVSMKEAKPIGVIQRIEYTLSHIQDRIDMQKEYVHRIKQEERNALEELEKGNDFTSQVDILSRTLLDIDAELERRASENTL